MIIGLKQLIVELMNKAKKCYGKLFKKCLTEKPTKNVKSKKVTKKS